MTDTNAYRLFNEDVYTMNNRNNMSSLIIQLLVQNYLEQKYKTKNVYVYSEAINDIDIFTKDIDEEFKTNLKIKTFIDILPDNSYSSSFEVKTGKISYILQFKNLLQLITKSKYQDNTKLQLIVVPSRCSSDMNELKEKYKIFNDLKEQILNKPIEEQKKIFNTFINKTFLFDNSILEAIIHVLGMNKNNKLKETYETFRSLTKRRDRINKHINEILKVIDNLDDIKDLIKYKKKVNKEISRLNDNNITEHVKVIRKLFNNINELVNDIKQSLYMCRASDTVINIINEASKNIDYEINNNKDITDKQFNILKNNFANVSIEILTIEDLSKCEITTEYLLKTFRRLQ